MSNGCRLLAKRHRLTTNSMTPEDPASSSVRAPSPLSWHMVQECGTPAAANLHLPLLSMQAPITFFNCQAGFLGAHSAQVCCPPCSSYALPSARRLHRS